MHGHILLSPLIYSVSWRLSPSFSSRSKFILKTCYPYMFLTGVSRGGVVHRPQATFFRSLNIARVVQQAPIYNKRNVFAATEEEFSGLLMRRECICGRGAVPCRALGLESRSFGPQKCMHPQDIILATPLFFLLFFSFPRALPVYCLQRYWQNTVLAKSKKGKVRLYYSAL